MAKRCYRCKVEYESGGYYNGNGYCMTCYVRAMQDDERRRRDAGREAQAKELAARKDRDERWAREQKAREDQRSRETAQLELLKKIRREKAVEEKPKRRDWGAGVQPAIAQPPQHGFAVKRPALAQKKEGIGTFLPSRAPRSGMEKHDEMVGEGKEKHEEANQGLTLEASGLPVSVSVGQKGLDVSLRAKNSGSTALSVSFTVSVADSEGKPLEVALEPKNAVLEAGAQAGATAKFDLGETTAKGPLTLSAYVSESAFYLDRPSAKSNTATLTAQVKMPMRLQYRKGSAVFEATDGNDALCLTFDNLGESGGRLSTKSSAGFGKGKAMERAPLFESRKIKGMEKNVVLRFSPAKRIEIEKVEVELVGVDSNGKPYNDKRIAENKGKK